MQKFFFNLKGELIEKTPETHPYSYDSFVVYKSPDFNDDYTATDSDRMLLWDYEKFQTAYKKIWGTNSQSFSCKDHREINNFLNLYFGKEVKLEAVIQNCNASSGFPYWTFLTSNKTDESCADNINCSEEKENA